MDRIRIGDVDLAFVRTGSGSDPARPVLVLLNGLFQRIDRWDAVLPHLAGYDVLRYDMRGQGSSSAPPGVYTPEVHVADLRGLLEALRIERFSAIGLSNGGVVGQLLAIEPPRGLACLVLVCTTPRIDVALRAKLASWGDALAHGGVSLRVKVSLPWAFGASFLSAHPEVLDDESIASAVAIAPSVAAHRSLLDGLLALGDLRPRLGAIRARTLVVSGEEDVLFPPSYGREIAERIVGAEFVTMPLGHTLPLEDPRGFANTVVGFLEKSRQEKPRFSGEEKTS